MFSGLPCETHIAHSKDLGDCEGRRILHGFCMVVFLHGFACGFLHDTWNSLFFCMTRGTACFLHDTWNSLFFFA